MLDPSKPVIELTVSGIASSDNDDAFRKFTNLNARYIGYLPNGPKMK